MGARGTCGGGKEGVRQVAGEEEDSLLIEAHAGRSANARAASKRGFVKVGISVGPCGYYGRCWNHKIFPV